MNLPDIPLMSILKDRMSWLSQRQDVLSQNVANADTPGFTPHDLKPVDFEQVLKNEANPPPFAGGLMVDNPRQIALSPPDSTTYGDYRAPDSEADPSGNTVSLEEEMIKVSDTQAQYQAASNLYAKAISMMKTAIGQV